MARGFRRSPMMAALAVALLSLVLIDLPASPAAANGLRRAARTDALATPQIILLAHRGSPRHQAYLGFMYEHGRGVPQDYKRAAQWYHLAAQAGDPRGQHWLGMLYNKGFGVPASYIQAHKWLNLAAAGASDADRDYFIRMRDAVATKLNRPASYEAQRRARDWSDFHALWLPVE